jgi:hypothetical protein
MMLAAEDILLHWNGEKEHNT